MDASDEAYNLHCFSSFGICLKLGYDLPQNTDSENLSLEPFFRFYEGA